MVFVDDVQPFLTGCVALDNQARFAEKSGAMALVVGPASRVERTTRPMTVSGDILKEIWMHSWFSPITLHEWAVIENSLFETRSCFLFIQLHPNRFPFLRCKDVLLLGHLCKILSKELFEKHPETQN